jgi:hypothetical protein
MFATYAHTLAFCVALVAMGMFYSPRALTLWMKETDRSRVKLFCTLLLFETGSPWVRSQNEPDQACPIGLPK